mmetsp:Transcript_92758/g.288610  ORF Transcript_92758/g.288610 Transcript_92758/m.288610 type:complete len:569 (-) Transcript_92758:483-2189(-)
MASTGSRLPLLLVPSTIGALLCWCLLWAKLSSEHAMVTAATRVQQLTLSTYEPVRRSKASPRQQSGRFCQSASVEDGCDLQDLMNLIGGNAKERRLEAAIRAVHQLCGTWRQLEEPREWQASCTNRVLDTLLQLDEVVNDARSTTYRWSRWMMLVGIACTAMQLACIAVARRTSVQVSIAHEEVFSQLQQLEKRLEVVLQAAYDATLHVQAVAPFTVLSAVGQLGCFHAMDITGKSVKAFARSQNPGKRLSLCLQAMATGCDSADTNPGAASLRVWWKDKASPGPQSWSEVEMTLVERIHSRRDGLVLRIAVRQTGRTENVGATCPVAFPSLPAGAASSGSEVTMSADFDTRKFQFFNRSSRWQEILQQLTWDGLVALLTTESSSTLTCKFTRLLRSTEAEAAQTVLVKFARNKGVGMMTLSHRAAEAAVVRVKIDLFPSATGAKLGTAAPASQLADDVHPRRASSALALTPLLQCQQLMCEVVRHCNYEILDGSCCTFHAGLAFVQEAMRGMNSEACATFSSFRVAEGWQCPVCSTLNDDALADDPPQQPCCTCFGCGGDTQATRPP